MIQISKKFLILTSVLLGAMFFNASNAHAVNGVVFEFENSPLSLFDEANFLPGNSVTRWIKATNNSGESQPIATEAINYPSYPDHQNIFQEDLSRALEITIRESGGSDLYGGSSVTGVRRLFNFYEDGETFLSNLPNADVTEYEFEIFFPEDKENEWQKKATSFDILIGIQGQEGGGGGGGGLPPGLTISGEETKVFNCCGINPSAIVTWNTSYFSTSQVIYGTTSGVFDLSEPRPGGPPKYGYDDYIEGDDSGSLKVTHHNVTLTGLSENITYYYRAVSHASPATIGKEHSFEIICLDDGEDGDIPIPTPIPVPAGPSPVPGQTPEPGPSPEPIPSPGPSPDDSIEPSPTSTSSEPEVAGFFPNFLAAAGSIFGNFWNTCYPCFPWWLILIFAVYCLLQAFLNKKKDKQKLMKWSIITISLTALAIIFYFVNYRCIAIWILLLLASLIFILWRLWIVSEKSSAWPEHMERKSIFEKMKKDKVLFLGIIIFLILLVIYLILKCLHPWVIVTALVFFALGANIIKRKQK